MPWFPVNIRDLDLSIDTLDGGTALINEDPYGEGWVIKIQLGEGADLSSLLTAEAYAAEVG